MKNFILPSWVLLLLALALGSYGYGGLVGMWAERDHPPDGQFVDVTGGRLHLVDLAAERPAGDGQVDRPTILLIHGASSNHADLLATLGHDLRRQYRVIAIDRPGHGWSERLGGSEMAAPDAQARAMIEVLEQRKSGAVIIVAHSLAGASAAHMALARPDLVKGLVLLSAVTHPWPGGIEWYYRLAATPVLGPVFTRIIAVPAASLLLDDGAHRVFAPSVPPPDYIETGRLRLLLRPENFVANALDVAALKGFVAAQRARYGALAMPIVAITGDTDSVVSPVIHSAALVRDVQNGRLVVLAGVGHMPHHGGQDRVRAEILRLAETVNGPS